MIIAKKDLSLKPKFEIKPALKIKLKPPTGKPMGGLNLRGAMNPRLIKSEIHSEQSEESFLRKTLHLNLNLNHGNVQG